MALQFWEQIKPLLNQPVEYSESNFRCHRAIHLISENALEQPVLNRICEIVGSRYGQYHPFSRGDKPMWSLWLRDVQFDNRFRRKTFNPDRDYDSRTTLSLLRTLGMHRFLAVSQQPEKSAYDSLYDHGSSAMRELLLAWLRRNKVSDGAAFMDFGAGNSGDCTIAERLGYNAVGFDLFPRSGLGRQYKQPSHVIADIAEALPLASNSVDAAVCQAVIDLIEPEARLSFYREVYRVMKPGGRFCISLQQLVNGWGFKRPQERALAMSIGFKLEGSTPTGYIFSK